MNFSLSADGSPGGRSMSRSAEPVPRRTTGTPKRCRTRTRASEPLHVSSPTHAIESLNARYRRAVNASRSRCASTPRRCPTGCRRSEEPSRWTSSTGSREYESMTYRSLGEEAGRAWLTTLAPICPRMTRVFIRPEWVALLDFETGLPSAIEVAMEAAAGQAAGSGSSGVKSAGGARAHRQGRQEGRGRNHGRGHRPHVLGAPDPVAGGRCLSAASRSRPGHSRSIAR